MSVGRICPRTVVSAVPNEAALDVARRMEEFDVGTVELLAEETTNLGRLLRSEAPAIASRST